MNFTDDEKYYTMSGRTKKKNGSCTDHETECSDDVKYKQNFKCGDNGLMISLRQINS